MSPSGGTPTPEQRRAFAPNVENLVLGLFGKGTGPFFNVDEAAPDTPQVFARSDAVFAATFDYVSALMKIWRTEHPGQRLAFSPSNKPRERVEPLILPDLSKPPIPLEPASAMPDPPTTATETTAMTQPGPADSETSGPPEPEPIPASRSEPDSAPAAPPEPPAVKPGQIPAAGRPPARAVDPRASFHLPNARVGVPYAAPIEGRDSEGRPVRILDVRIPEGLGLDFDPESAELRGTPRTDGDHRLRVLWTPSRGASYSDDCLLIVNPDPRSLWKILEPPADAPYPKPHTEALWIPGETGQLLGASRRGRSHEHAASFRDDDFFIRQDADSGWNLLMVADGAGSARFSREGSRLAVRSAGEHLAASLAGDLGARMTAALNQWDSDPEATGQTMGREFHFLFHEAGTRALRAIEQEAQTRDTPVRDYATTLLTAAIRRRGRATFLATFWMGDGAIAAYGPRGRVRLMGSPDGGEFAGQTRFLDRAALSDQGFAKRIGIGYFEDLSAVMLMTDGVSDPRFETDNGLNDPARWDRLWDELTPILESPEPDRGLLDWMDFFSPGNHDDRTIALLW